jgi:hypothetical protein
VVCKFSYLETALLFAVNALLGSIPAPIAGCPHPRFPVWFRGFPELDAPFLKEKRTRGPIQSYVQQIRGISLVFREMWDIAGLPLKPVEGYNEDALRGYNPEMKPAPPAPLWRVLGGLHGRAGRRPHLTGYLIRLNFKAR